MRGADRTLLLSASGLRATNDGTADFSWQMKGGKEEGGTECERMSWPGFFLSPPFNKEAGTICIRKPVSSFFHHKAAQVIAGNVS